MVAGGGEGHGDIGREHGKISHTAAQVLNMVEVWWWWWWWWWDTDERGMAEIAAQKKGNEFLLPFLSVQFGNSSKEHI